MTFEDVKRIRQNPTAEDCDNKELSKLIDIALEKQIPKKVIEYRLGGFCCSDCKAIVYPTTIYCPHCGQALDWSEAE